MPRHVPKPDKRLDWRDPTMPVIRDYIVEDDLGILVERGTEEVPPEVITEVAAYALIDCPFPDWKDDPSYNWGEGKRKRRR